MNNRAGKEVTNFTGDAAYKSFLPAPLPPSPALILDDESVVPCGCTFSAVCIERSFFKYSKYQSFRIRVCS